MIYFHPLFLRRRPPLISAGRLDKWASGLLVLSQDGDLVNRLTSPKRKAGVVGKIYDVKLANPLSGTEGKRFASGDLKLKNETKPCRPAKLEVLDAENRLVRITLFEGRYHQLRRMLAALNNKALEIKRVATGPLELGDLPPGRWRHLTTTELDLLDVTSTNQKNIREANRKKKKLKEKREKRKLAKDSEKTTISEGKVGVGMKKNPRLLGLKDEEALMKEMEEDEKDYERSKKEKVKIEKFNVGDVPDFYKNSKTTKKSTSKKTSSHETDEMKKTRKVIGFGEELGLAMGHNFQNSKKSRIDLSERTSKE
eukprot:TRINITY_DN12009_c0_g1_i2.p1 TRINITY_DN12009_c0_g1~~TRINITY_DN12009_c0_g1_i2.p1  ORF type:complete len:311 (-),score=76.04 TRINITY_DN12009_c0_g1_i2:134-1066(-)